MQEPRPFAAWTVCYFGLMAVLGVLVLLALLSVIFYRFP